MEEYIILSCISNDSSLIEKIVNTKMKDGYIPMGGICVTHRGESALLLYSQAMMFVKVGD